MVLMDSIWTSSCVSLIGICWCLPPGPTPHLFTLCNTYIFRKSFSESYLCLKVSTFLVEKKSFDVLYRLWRCYFFSFRVTCINVSIKRRKYAKTYLMSNGLWKYIRPLLLLVHIFYSRLPFIITIFKKYYTSKKTK